MQPDLLGSAHDGSGVADSVPVIERLGSEIAALRKIIADLLRHCGTKGVCRGAKCQQDILFIVHANGAITPYNQDGTSHFGTCVDRDLFHRRRK